MEKVFIVLSCEGRDEGLRFSSMEPVEVTVLFKEKKNLGEKEAVSPLRTKMVGDLIPTCKIIPIKG